MNIHPLRPLTSDERAFALDRVTDPARAASTHRFIMQAIWRNLQAERAAGRLFACPTTIANAPGPLGGDAA